MTDLDSRAAVKSGLAGRVGWWLVALLAVYVAYSATLFRGRPDAVADFLAIVVANLHGTIAMLIPPAVFAGALAGCGLCGGGGEGAARGDWRLVLWISLGAYLLGALVDPVLARWTGSDWTFPPSLLRSAEVAREAAEAAKGSEARNHSRDAAYDLARFFIPIANAAFVWVAAALGERTGRLTRALSPWPRYSVRWLAGGLILVSFWIPARMADELVTFWSAWGGLLLVMPLFLPLVVTAILFAIARPGRGFGP